MAGREISFVVPSEGRSVEGCDDRESEVRIHGTGKVQKGTGRATEQT